MDIKAKRYLSRSVEILSGLCNNLDNIETKACMFHIPIAVAFDRYSDTDLTNQVSCIRMYSSIAVQTLRWLRNIRFPEDENDEVYSIIGRFTDYDMIDDYLERFQTIIKFCDVYNSGEFTRREALSIINTNNWSDFETCFNEYLKDISDSEKYFNSEYNVIDTIGAYVKIGKNVKTIGTGYISQDLRKHVIYEKFVDLCEKGELKPQFLEYMQEHPIISEFLKGTFHAKNLDAIIVYCTKCKEMFGDNMDYCCWKLLMQKDKYLKIVNGTKDISNLIFTINTYGEVFDDEVFIEFRDVDINATSKRVRNYRDIYRGSYCENGSNYEVIADISLG